MKKITFMKKMIFTLLLCLGGSVSGWAAYTGTGVFTEIASLTDLTDGYYVVAYGSTFAMNSTNAGSLFTNTAITPTTGVLTNPAAAIVWKIQTHVDGGRTIYNESTSKFVSYTGSSNAAQAVAAVTAGSERWTFAWSTTVFTITNITSSTRLLQYNTSSPRFACYTGTQKNITLYKMASVSVPVVSAGSPTGTVGVAFNYQIIATNSPTSYAVSAGTLPDGLTLNTTTGEITGTPTTAGTPIVSVTATNTGGTSDPATLSFTIAAGSKTAQTITFGAFDSKTYGAATFELTGSASSTLAVSYTSSNEAVATVSGTTVTIVGAGSTDITASQAGDVTYDPAPSVMHSLAVTGKELTLADAAVTPKTYTGTNTAVITGTLTGIINADAVTLVGAGLFADVNVGTGIAVTSNASLAGAKAGNYILTQPTGLTGDITKASQTITFGALASKVASDAAFTLFATASSTLTVAYASSNEAVATVSGNTVTLVAGGTTTITATQAGNGNYDAAVAVPQTLSVNFAAPVASAASRQTGSSMFANWAVVPGATGYLVDVYKKSGTGVSYTALSENFDGFTLGTATVPTSTDAAATTLDGKTQIIGWTGSKVFDAAGTIKMGTSSVLGYIVTPSIDLSGNGGNFGINFKSMAWSTDSIKMKIYLNDVLVSTVSPLNNDASYTLSPFSIDLTGGTATSKIKFEGNQAAKGRFFMEDLVITSGVSPTLTPIAGSPFPVMGGAVDSLYLSGLSYDTYYYTVKATDGVMTSAASNEITFVINATTNIVTPSADRMYVAGGRLFVTGSQAFSVYSTQGVQVASVSANSASSSIALRPGIYVVKTTNRVQKVVVR